MDFYMSLNKDTKSNHIINWKKKRLTLILNNKHELILLYIIMKRPQYSFIKYILWVYLWKGLNDCKWDRDEGLGLLSLTPYLNLCCVSIIRAPQHFFYFSNEGWSALPTTGHLLTALWIYLNICALTANL